MLLSEVKILKASRCFYIFIFWVLNNCNIFCVLSSDLFFLPLLWIKENLALYYALIVTLVKCTKCNEYFCMKNILGRGIKLKFCCMLWPHFMTFPSRSLFNAWNIWLSGKLWFILLWDIFAATVRYKEYTSVNVMAIDQNKQIPDGLSMSFLLGKESQLAFPKGKYIIR